MMDRCPQASAVLEHAQVMMVSKNIYRNRTADLPISTSMVFTSVYYEWDALLRED